MRLWYDYFIFVACFWNSLDISLATYHMTLNRDYFWMEATKERRLRNSGKRNTKENKNSTEIIQRDRKVSKATRWKFRLKLWHFIYGFREWELKKKGKCSALKERLIGLLLLTKRIISSVFPEIAESFPTFLLSARCRCPECIQADFSIHDDQVLTQKPNNETHSLPLLLPSPSAAFSKRRWQRRHLSEANCFRAFVRPSWLSDDVEIRRSIDFLRTDQSRSLDDCCLSFHHDFHASRCFFRYSALLASSNIVLIKNRWRETKSTWNERKRCVLREEKYLNARIQSTFHLTAFRRRLRC